MLVYLTGDSELRKELYIREFLKKEKNCEYRKIFSDENGKIQELINASMSGGLFSNRKIYDLVDFDQWSKSEREEFSKIDFSKEELIVFVRTEKVGKDVKDSKHVSILSFEKPKEWEEEKWIEFIVENSKWLGVELPNQMAIELFRLIGTDEMALLTELEKLRVYSDRISLEDIGEIVYKRTVSKLDEFLFALSEMQLVKAYGLVDEVVKQYEPVIVVYSLSKHFIDLMQIVVLCSGKPFYPWPEIVEISKKTSVPIPKVARFVGFKFKDSKYMPVNHMEMYTPKKIKSILEILYYIDRQVKLGNELKILLLDFIQKLKNLDKHIEASEVSTPLEEGED